MRQPDHDAFQTALLEERPEISPDFAAELDRWAAEGFPPREGEAPTRPHRSLRSRLPKIGSLGILVPAGGFAVALIALVIGLSSLQGGGDSDDSGGGFGEESLSTTVQEPGREAETGGATPPGAAQAPADDVAAPAPEPNLTVPPVPPGGGDRLRPAEDRIQEKTVSTTLSTDPDEVAEVSDGVVEVTERYDGIVSSSNVNTTGDRGRATFALRIPTQNLQAFLSDLSDLASVQSRNEGTLDITAPYVSAEERFDDAKAEVDSLVAQLAEAGSTTEIDDIKSRLIIARSELAAARTELAELKQRADFSRVSVTVTGEGDSDGWSIGDAADDAGSVLSDIAGALLVALAAIVPLGLIAAAIWFGATKLRRRRRESVLDD